MNTGSLNFKQLAGDATNLFNRAVQFTSEQIVGGEKTEYDSQLATLIKTADNTKDWTEKVVSQSETLLQPNPALRAEAFVNSVFDRKVPEHMTITEQLGCYLEDAGSDLGQHTAYGTLLKTCGLTERKLGAAERKFHKEALANFVSPLKNYLNTEMAAMQREKRILDTKRLDLDVAKNRVRKCTKPAELPTVEQHLKVCQDEFDRQAEVVRLMMSEVPSHHRRHLTLLRQFVQLQTQFYAECSSAMQELDSSLNTTNTQDPRYFPSGGAPLGNTMSNTSSSGGTNASNAGGGGEGVDMHYTNNGYLSFS
ncbi:endophilin-B1-like [Symsagittifera roscoffensis]|uniref:endophilin-B1-like n=1 Tax=Symsagittifera roscoffensis TaxID=84072 RepID=UPI00307B5218